MPHPDANRDVMAPRAITNKSQVHHLEVLESTTMFLSPKSDILFSGEARLT